MYTSSECSVFHSPLNINIKIFKSVKIHKNRDVKISRQTSSVFLYEVKFLGVRQAYNSHLIGSEIEMNIYERILYLTSTLFFSLKIFNLIELIAVPFLGILF